MKVLFVSSGNSKYGLSPVVKSQGESLKRHGIQLEFFAIIGQGFFAYFKHLFILRSRLKNNTYDIVHAHYGLSGIIALLARRKEKIIVSFMGSDLLVSEMTNRKTSFTLILLTWINKFLSRYFYNYTIVKSIEMLRKSGNNINISVCPNGVNLDKFYPVEKKIALEKTGFSDNDINIIFVSDPLRHEKNFPLAQEGISLLNTETLKLHVINDISPELLKYYYSAADLLIMTSFYEGSPNVIKEAMACNCPVICTDVGDVKQLFGNTEGYYIICYDQEDVAEKIKMVIDFRQKNNQTKGRDQIIEMGLDSESVAKRILDVYDKAMFKD